MTRRVVSRKGGCQTAALSLQTLALASTATVESSLFVMFYQWIFQFVFWRLIFSICRGSALSLGCRRLTGLCCPNARDWVLVLRFADKIAMPTWTMGTNHACLLKLVNL